jgi:trans-2,3-dihydro-3-hydroxyanthranilate isomerase
VGRLTLPIIHTNVFGMTPEGGNPCPIVFDADGLSGEQMQSLAAHFGLETAFVLAPAQPNCDLRLRYFVPRHEMEMCGHATVGTVSVLVSRNRLTSSPVNIETPLGAISVDWRRDRHGIRVTVAQFPPTFSTENPTGAEVASALGISERAIAFNVGPIQSVSTSRPKLMIPIREREVLDGLQPDFERLWSLCDQYQTTGLYPFTIQAKRVGTHAEARQFPKRAGYNEDPATGVAACALGAYLTEYEIFEEKTAGWHAFQIEQGHAMGRPSIIQAESYAEDGRIIRTRISGHATVVSEEFITV